MGRADMITFSIARAKMIPLLWVTAKPLIEVAVEHSNGELDIDLIYKKLIGEEMALITVTEDGNVLACLTVEKRIYNSGKNVLNITTAGGEGIHKWMGELSPLMDDMARKYDCTEIYIVGRPGWDRMIKDFGFQKIHTICSRKVGDK